MLRAALVLVLATALVAAEEPRPPVTSPPAATSSSTAAPQAAAPIELTPRTGRDDAKSRSLLETILREPEATKRKAAIDELMSLAPTSLGALDAWLQRPHGATVDDRRAVLAAIEAQVPDATGKFATPQRQTGNERKADDDLDWLPKLLALDPAMVGLGEVIADDAAIRALAASHSITAAKPIFEAAFRDDTMIYRDECGRYLRKLEPYSIPLLTVEAQGKGDRRRYANYQLERIDRQEPLKALSAAEGDEALMISILGIFRQTKLREAVHAVWKRVDDPRPKVRAAARATWMDYITGPPPKPAPMKKLQLPGGKLTKKEKPLWLTYRELADNELRQAANTLLHEDYPIEDPMSLDDHEKTVKVVKIDLVEVTQRLFDYFDSERAKQDAAEWAVARTKAEQGDVPGAAAQIDRMLAQNPHRTERAEMAAVFFTYAKALEADRKWAEASAAYSKAHGLDPKGAKAKDALALHHFTQGKALEADGKDGGADYRKAVALRPDFERAQDAAEQADGASGRPSWMLYGAALAAALAALMFAGAMIRRRA